MVQVELNEERREGEALLASRLEELEKQRREWKKTSKALENQEQAPGVSRCGETWSDMKHLDVLALEYS